MLTTSRKCSLRTSTSFESQESEKTGNFFATQWTKAEIGMQQFSQAKLEGICTSNVDVPIVLPVVCRRQREISNIKSRWKHQYPANSPMPGEGIRGHCQKKLPRLLTTIWQRKAVSKTSFTQTVRNHQPLPGYVLEGMAISVTTSILVTFFIVGCSAALFPLHRHL